jgi:hypothetical protein
MIFFIHLSSQQLRIAIKGDCQVVVHGMQVAFDIHLEWIMLQIVST